MCETPTPGNAPKYLKNSATRLDGVVGVVAEATGAKQAIKNGPKIKK